MHQQQTAFENIVGKEEIALNEQFLLFPQCFLLNQKIGSPFVHIYDIISLFSAELEEPKIGMSGKVLRYVKVKPSQPLPELCLSLHIALSRIVSHHHHLILP